MILKIKNGLVILIFMLPYIASQAQNSKPSGLPEMLPRDLEIELALSAGPQHLRDKATVLVLGKDGYEVAIEGTNGWTALVIRNNSGVPAFDDMVAPFFYDEEGMRTSGKVSVDRAKYFKQGMSPAEIRDKINQGFASGIYKVPQKAGVIYMLSPFNKVPDHRTGKLFDYIPHVMYWGPNISNDDIGVPIEQHTHNKKYVWEGLPFIPNQGPHGFIVQPLGELECKKIIGSYMDMINKMRQYVTFQLKYEP